MTVHKVERFSNDSKLSHEQSVIRVCRYLLGIPEHGMVFKPMQNLGLEVFVNADFAGN